MDVQLKSIIDDINFGYKTAKNPFYRTTNLKQKALKFNTEFLTPIQQIKKMLEADQTIVITSKQIKEFIENPEPVVVSEYIMKTDEETLTESNISASEAVSRICDFD